MFEKKIFKKIKFDENRFAKHIMYQKTPPARMPTTSGNKTWLGRIFSYNMFQIDKFFKSGTTKHTIPRKR